MPHIEYGLLIYGNSKKIANICKLQKWGIRAAANKKYNAHTEPLMKKFSVLKVHDLYKTKIINFVRQCVDHEDIPVKMVQMLEYHLEKNRIKYYLTQRKPISRILDSLPYYKIPVLWNQEKFKELYPSTKSFTYRYKNKIISSYSFSCSIKNCYNCRTS